MKLTKLYTPTGKVKIVDENGFSICNMTSNVAKDNESNADYIIALNQQRNELLKALTRLYDSVDSCVDLTPEVMHQALTAIKNANQK
jgi:acetolactate synthase regulatory subunit